MEGMKRFRSVLLALALASFAVAQGFVLSQSLQGNAQTTQSATQG